MSVEVGWSKDPNAKVNWGGGPVSGVIAPDRAHRMRLVAAFPLVHWCAAGLDRRRLHWADTVPSVIQVTSLVIFALASAAVLWAMQVNPFFSSVVRLQHERGQFVITTGPYDFIRHPGDAAGIVLALTSGFALGSWLAV